VHAITPLVGVAAQGPSIACAEHQRARHAQKPPSPLARRPHDVLRFYANSLDGEGLASRLMDTRAERPQDTNQLLGVGSGAAEQWTQQGSPVQARCAPRAPTYGCRGRPEKVEACYRSPQKGVARWVIRRP